MNLRASKQTKKYDIIVDRRSILGNPFYMINEGYRDEVCKKYETWFKSSMLSNEKVKSKANDLRRLYKKYGKLRLFCWCAPKRCHAETIKKWLLENKL